MLYIMLYIMLYLLLSIQNLNLATARKQQQKQVSHVTQVASTSKCNFVIHIYRLEDRAKRVTYIPGHSIKKPGYTAWREQFVYIANPGKSGLGRSVSQTKLMNQCRHLFGVFLVAYFQKACRYSVRFLIFVGKPRTKSIDES